LFLPAAVGEKECFHTQVKQAESSLSNLMFFFPPFADMNKFILILLHKLFVMQQLKIFLLLIILLSGHPVVAQTPVSIDTLTEQINNLNKVTSTLKKIRISGFVQSQYQIADTAGAKTFAGGDFAPGVNNRFRIRRGEFKTMYDNGKTQIVANIDIMQSGVLIKDAYGRFTEQWLKSFSVTAGIFSRPFGWGVPTSSSMIGSPERARCLQILFPGERDLGAILTFRMPPTSKLSPLKIEGGLFNGTGNRADDFDNKKDFIGNIHWNVTAGNRKINYGFGISFYDGGWKQGNDTAYHTGTMADGSMGFVSTVIKDSKNSIAIRQYYGFDAQLSIKEPLGTTTVRVEYVAGKQPGTGAEPAGIAVSPTVISASSLPAVTLANGKSIPALMYHRQVQGFYAELLQDIGKTPLQVMIKYDWWDPNTKVSGRQLTNANGFTAADIQYTDLGLGLIYNWDENVKFMTWYDIVTNETTGLKGYTKDLPDNIWTFRIQYKF